MSLGNTVLLEQIRHCDGTQFYTFMKLGEISVYRHFQQFFGHIATVYTCDRYYWCYHVAPLTGVPCRKRSEHRYTTRSHYFDTRPTVLVVSPNAERQARKHLIRILQSLF